MRRRADFVVACLWSSRTMSKHFRVSASLRVKLEEAGLSVPSVLRAAGLPKDFFESARVLVNTEELFALWRAIGQVSPDPAIGLKIGTESRIERFAPVSLAALSSPTLRSAIEHMARFKRLSAPEEIRNTTSHGEWSIEFCFTLADESDPPALIENCFAWVMTIARRGAGTRIAPVRVELVGPRSYLKTLERYFKCPVVLGAARNAVVFRASDADVPFVTGNAEMLEALSAQLEQEMKDRYPNQETSFLALVRGAIQQRLAGRRPAIEEVARQLHMSSRTLQRRLQESGVSFQRVLDDARRQMARYYLSNSGLELNEAAYLLGYEDANSFARAFRGWEGMPPGHWRETRASATIS